jgi:hypothetical protein
MIDQMINHLIHLIQLIACGRGLSLYSPPLCNRQIKK